MKGTIPLSVGRGDGVESLEEYIDLSRQGGPLLALAVAARLVKVSRSRLYYCAKHGKIRVVKVKGQLHIHALALERWK